MSGPDAILDTLPADVASSHITFSRRRDSVPRNLLDARPFDLGNKTLV
jgi:hypothetical protein